MLDWDSVQLEILENGIYRWPAGVALPQRAWFAPHHDLWIIWAGRGRIKLRQGWTDVRPGTCLWRQPGAVYPGEHEAQDPLGLSYMHFQLSDADGNPIPATDLEYPEIYHPSEFAMADAIGRRIVNLMHGLYSTSHATSPDAEGTATSLLRALLRDLVSESQWIHPSRTPGADPRYRKVWEIAQRITLDPGMKEQYDVWAQETGYSTEHFRKLFKHLLGRSPNDFVIHWRLERAKTLLVQSGLSVAQVGRTLGYDDQAFFSRQFRARVGISPLAYRQANNSLSPDAPP